MAKLGERSAAIISYAGFTLMTEKMAKSIAKDSMFYKACLSFSLMLKELFKLEHMFQ
jgi:hypothetical protein